MGKTETMALKKKCVLKIFCKNAAKMHNKTQTMENNACSFWDIF